jgi:hypothetical protein
MIDINDPKDPTYAGCFQDHGYVHDTQCVVYEGPDRRYHGREICFNSNASPTPPTRPSTSSRSSTSPTRTNPVSLVARDYEGSATRTRAG